MGQPETVLEVDGGSIFIDFSDASATGQLRSHEEGSLTPRIQLTQNDSNANDEHTPREQSSRSKGTPLLIKRDKVAQIQVCEIRFNRTKAKIQKLIQ